MRKAISTTFIATIWLISLLILTNCDSTAQDTEYEYRNAATDLEVVWEIIWGPDDYLWVTERPGRVLRINPETGEKIQILDATDDVLSDNFSERGLMGMALSPDFANDGLVFISYTYEGNGQTLVKIERYEFVDGLLQNPMTIIDNIKGAGNHDGCRIEFDDEGKMFITTGDAANPSLAQDLTSINGKVLRLNPDGTIPSDNPYFGKSIARNEIWSIGHRNPQGLVYHNGTLYSSEHGPNTNDELNIIERERNYGWPDVEGFCNKTNEKDYCKEYNIKEPIAIYNENSTLAVAGIDFYDKNGDEMNYIQDFQNSILMTTLKTGLLRRIKLSEDGMTVVDEKDIIDGQYGRLRAVCVAPDGRVFVGTSNRDGRGSVRQNDDKIIEIKPKAQSGINTNSNGLLLDIYPNPSFGTLNFKSLSEENIFVKVFDLLGNKIDDLLISPNSTQSIDTGQLRTGTYNFQIIKNDKIENKILNIIN